MSHLDLTWSEQSNLAQKLTRYKCWGNRLSIEFALTLPAGEVEKQRDTYFGSILHTLHHNFIVDDIFRYHWEDREHGYTARRMETAPALADLFGLVENMDAWWVDESDRLTNEELNQQVDFTFINGSVGRMTKLEIIMHIVNHTSYHRGFVDELVMEIPAEAPATDFPVYLNEMARSAS